MAGPYNLSPNQVQLEIPTWGFGRSTTVHADCSADGFIEMRAGGSPAESTSVKAGSNHFTRDFGGVLLAVKNLTNGSMRVKTE
ncbi:MAG: hypothetical protein ACOYNY_38355 [Caldilineaceae bacterium]